MTSKLGPGPGAYMLPPVLGYKKHDRTRWQAPAYKLGIRHHQITQDEIPGPKYALRGFTRFGPAYKPTFIFNTRRTMKKPPQTPGPGAYAPEKHESKTKKEVPPAYSMGLAKRDLKPGFSPGPNAYNLSRKYPPGPAYSLGLALKTKSGTVSPGPAAYDARNQNPIKQKVPMYSMTPRSKVKLASVGPGPAYNVKYMPGRTAHGYSFGIRRPESILPYLLPEDNACIIDRNKACP